MVSDGQAPDALANPIINRHDEVPTRHFELGPAGPTGVLLTGRRPSESLTAVKGKTPLTRGRRSTATKTRSGNQKNATTPTRNSRTGAPNVCDLLTGVPTYQLSYFDRKKAHGAGCSALDRPAPSGFGSSSRFVSRRPRPRS